LTFTSAKVLLLLYNFKRKTKTKEIGRWQQMKKVSYAIANISVKLKKGVGVE